MDEELLEENKNFEKAIDEYLLTKYFDDHNVRVNKVFYNPFKGEWSGWRFYLKALKHRDFRSIIGHIKSHFLRS